MSAPESSLLADAVERFFAERCTSELVAAVEAGAETASLWSEAESLGLTLVAVPEENGGAGGSLIEAMTVLRTAGRHAVPLPLAETMLAGWVLAEAELPVPSGPMTLAPTTLKERLQIALGSKAACVRGHAKRVPWAADVAELVLLAEDDTERLHAVTLPVGLARITRGLSVAMEARDDVELDDVSVPRDSFAPVALSREEVQLRGALGRAAMMLGALERVRDLTVAHCRERSQFGRPIARFQAVQHLIAQIAREVALTRAAVDLAVSAASMGVGSAWLEIAAAKVVAGRAASGVAGWAHQAHGAIGVTKEYSLSTLTRRLWCWRDELGTEAEWSQHIGAQAWSEGGVWAFATSGHLPLKTP